MTGLRANAPCKRRAGSATPVLVVRRRVELGLARRLRPRRRADELERDLVDVAVLEVGEAEALVLAHRLDNGRERTALEEGW